LTTGGGSFIGLEPDEMTSDRRLLCRVEIGYRLFDLFGVRKYPLYVSAVACAGVFETPAELKDLEAWADMVRLGAGIGVRANTPLGPLTVDVGAADLNPGSPDRIGAAVYLAIGREFRYVR
jgi:hypothetical protein